MSAFKRVFAIVFVAFSLGACSAYDPATRNAQVDVASFQSATPSFDVTELRIQVPQELSVSEANTIYPIADIVWRGDPRGNRHKQVLDIFAASIQAGTDTLEGVQPVAVDIEVTKFHSLTERARYTVGGVHTIRFLLTVRDAQSGDALISERLVNADLMAFGGQAALNAEAMGQSQKVRISEHLTALIVEELSRPLSGPSAIF
ncbi:MAG: DUF6778 family protein [Pseudomonadota bacterium]